MPISSYLAIPKSLKKEQLIQDINSFENCEVLPSENKDLIIVVTDTLNSKEEESLYEQISSLESIQQLTMVSGYDNP